MNNLADWQQAFSESLLGDLSTSLRNSFQQTTSTSQEQRFAIYQNNVFYSLTNALGDLYPVIKKLVGDEFFTGTASYFLRQHPPKQAAMVHFGQDFPHFLCEFEHTHHMPYLQDVAQLELARHRAYHAEDKNPLPSDTLAKFHPEQLALAVLTLHPSLSLIASDFPIFNIWQSNQDDNYEQENIQLNERQHVLVVRVDYDVALYAIDPATYTFIEKLTRGEELQVAIEQTIDLYDQFDISTAIHFLIQEQLLTDIHYNND